MDEPVSGGVAHHRARGEEWLFNRFMAAPEPAEPVGAAVRSLR